MGRKAKPRQIPEQDKRICGSICLCQLIMVLSCVSIVYLSVAVYSPSFKAFKSGYEIDPVMCQTYETHFPNNCPWASCGEWCLTKTSGYCPQISSTVRRNGTDIILQNCKRINTTPCPQIDMEKLKKLNCNNGTECASLNGVFLCSLGHCKNLSEFFDCHQKPDFSHTINPDKDNTKLNGFFECHKQRCASIPKPFSCDRYCPKITTADANALLMENDNLITAYCDNGIAMNEANGAEPGFKLTTPKEFWKEDDGILLTNCMSVIRNPDSIVATDCLNGTLLNETDIPHPYMNFTQFWKIYEQSNHLVDIEQKFLPQQSNVTINKSAKLLINLEGCVNTLRGECKEFGTRYGNDGDNNTAQSRYQCYYNKKDSSHVIARYDLETTYRDLMIALIVPTTLFIVSFTALCIITKSVKVGDDAKMRCVCFNKNSDTDDIYTGNVRKMTRNETHEQFSPLEDDDHDIDIDIEEQQKQDDNNDETTENNPEFIGSTKSLVPLSACDDCTEKTLLSSEQSV